jgi:hypothetical protein
MLDKTHAQLDVWMKIDKLCKRDDNIELYVPRNFWYNKIIGRPWKQGVLAFYKLKFLYVPCARDILQLIMYTAHENALD